MSMKSETRGGESTQSFLRMVMEEFDRMALSVHCVKMETSSLRSAIVKVLYMADIVIIGQMAN